MKKIALACFLNLLLVICGAGQTTTFTYQGRLLDNSLPATAPYDFEFRLFDLVAGGVQQGATQQLLGVPVTNGVFTVNLDFGPQFPGAGRFVEISVRNAPGAFTTLAPRQPVASGPYSIKSLNSDTSMNANQLGGITASQYVITTDTRLSDARDPLPGSGSYVQNSNSPQSANFTIDGNGTVGGTLSGNIVHATTRYELDGFPVLSNAGSENLFAGIGAGQSHTTGSGNAFFGRAAGGQNSTGDFNAFFGRRAGFANTTASGNAFFGDSAGWLNTTGADNAFFGGRAGFANTTGAANAFFGRDAGGANTTGVENAFFGRDAGRSNTSGLQNAFFGMQAGFGNTTGSFNAFFGLFAGSGNTTGQDNAFFGAQAGQASTTANENAFFGGRAGRFNTTGFSNAFVGKNAGVFNTTGNSNAFFGAIAGSTNTTGSNNTIIGQGANVGSSGLTFATAIGSEAVVTQNNRVQLGRQGGDTVSIGIFAVASATQLCVNGHVLSVCSSSARYKESIRPFAAGIDLVRRLRPVTFDWIERSEPDLGLIAEEVAKVEPLLVTRNQKGEIEGVKYDQITVTLINAVKEQQAQIESLQQQGKEQRAEIKAFRELVCSQNLTAKACLPK